MKLKGYFHFGNVTVKFVDGPELAEREYALSMKRKEFDRQGFEIEVKRKDSDHKWGASIFIAETPDTHEINVPDVTFDVTDDESRELWGKLRQIGFTETAKSEKLRKKWRWGR